MTNNNREILQSLKDRLDLQKSQYPFATPLFEILSKVVSMVQEMKARVDRVEKMEGPSGKDGRTPIAGIDFPLPKDGVDGHDGRDAKEQIFVGKNPPPNPKKGDLWSKV